MSSCRQAKRQKKSNAPQQEQQQQEQFSLLDLPDLCLGMIISYATVSDLCSLDVSCSYFRRITDLVYADRAMTTFGKICNASEYCGGKDTEIHAPTEMDSK